MSLADAVRMQHIVKQFGSVLANDDVDFEARQGEIHALLGENGAGKSTMMCMLSGVYRPTSGDILIKGEKVRIRSPKDAMKLGIGMVFQNFRLVNTLSAAENIVLGENAPVWRSSRWMKHKAKEIEGLAERLGLAFKAERPVWQLSVGEQQRVEIVKTLYRGADLIILDEPTSVLTPGEVDELFKTLGQLKTEGKTVIITTHKLKEVMAVSDRISVMRKGKMIHTVDKAATTERDLARLMVGMEMRETRRHEVKKGGKPLLIVKDLEVQGAHGHSSLDGLDLRVDEGEIVGIAGVAGNGQRELAEVLNGLIAWKKGSIEFDGKHLRGHSVRDAIDLGISHVPENRMKSGLAGPLDLVDNLLFKSYRKPERSLYGFLRNAANKIWSKGLVEKFDVKTPGVETPVQHLSGGNQQKLVFAREIHQQPKLMVAVHPTQGLDVGATEGVHTLLRGIRDEGRSVLLISEDLDEVLQLSDRILVIFGGKIVGEVSGDKADREHIGLMMAGAHAAETVKESAV